MAGLDRPLARGAELGVGNRAVEDVHGREAEAGAVEEAEQGVLAPERGGADLPQPAACRRLLESRGEGRAQAVSLCGRGDAECLEAQLRLRASEIAFERASQQSHSCLVFDCSFSSKAVSPSSIGAVVMVT